jgi:hypothetical protein
LQKTESWFKKLSFDLINGTSFSEVLSSMT